MAKIYIKCDDPVTVTCYGETKTWEREDALHFFLQCMRYSEGAEHERYETIYFQLMDGMDFASDQIDWRN